MSNGTRPAVSVGELLSGDGPFERAADDYLADTCSRCRRPVGRDGVHHSDGFLCSSCWGWESVPAAV